MSRLLDPKRDGKWPFEYRSAAQTDVRKTFKRVREELRANQDRADKVVRSIATRNGKP